LPQVLGEPFQHLLLQQQFIHHESQVSRASGKGLDYDRPLWCGAGQNWAGMRVDGAKMAVSKNRGMHEQSGTW
jgi:hypothetical protein